MKYRNLQKLLFALLITMFSCDDDSITFNSTGEVIVINEGNFTDSDGSLSVIDVTTGQTNNNVFNIVNGRPFGGIIQNAVLYNGQIFVLTNSGDKMEVLNATTFESIGAITSGLTSPFSFAGNGNKGYISNWGVFNLTTFAYEGSYISVIDLSTFQITKNIDLAEQPQHLLALGNVVLIANVSASSISVLSTDTDNIIRDISVPPGPDKMLLDNGGAVWVICNSGSLAKLDPSLTSIDMEIQNVPVSGFNEKIAMGPLGSELLVLSVTGFMPAQGTVFKVNLSTGSISPTPLISQDNIYALGIDPFDGTVYISDNNAFQGNGTVITFDSEGNQLNTFPVGRGPNGFIFR